MVGKLKARRQTARGSCYFTGVGDNRAGTATFARFLLPAGYDVVMMDSRGQGDSGGGVVTYGWLERRDVSQIISTLKVSEPVQHVFVLGISMGAAIALQAAGADTRIEGVVAEDPLASLQEVAYDYAGFQRSVFLGKTLFRPAAIAAIRTLAATQQIDPYQVAPKYSVAQRGFPVLLICGTEDQTIPCRHADAIFSAAHGTKHLWIVEGAAHASAYGEAPTEYKRRVLEFFGDLSH